MIMQAFAYVHGQPRAKGRIRCQLTDFLVQEALSFEPAGAGEHVLLQIRKQGSNTQWVARQLAEFAAVPEHAVGYAGLKDRHAVAEQWFSVPIAISLTAAETTDWWTVQDKSFSILKIIRHNRKLRHGALRLNKFTLIIREFRGDYELFAQRFQGVTERGAPNYFAEQRFGHDGNNLRQAEAMFKREQRVRNRQQRGLYLSAARSWVFNHVLSKRVAMGNWDRYLSGDVMLLNGRRAWFQAEADDAQLQLRLDTKEIHPSGPLWGTGELPSQAEACQLEMATGQQFSAFCRGLEKAKLQQERRALRVMLQEASVQRVAEDQVQLQFSLPAGSYATAVLRELLLIP